MGLKVLGCCTLRNALEMHPSMLGVQDRIFCIRLMRWGFNKNSRQYSIAILHKVTVEGDLY